MDGNAPGPASFLFRRSLGGSKQLEQTILVDWLVKKKAGARFKSNGHGAGALIVANQDNRCGAVPSRDPHLAGQLDAIGGGHVQVQEDHIELSFVEKTRSVSAFCEGHSLNTSGSQNFPNHFADRCLIIHDQTSSLHVTLHFLAFAGSHSKQTPTLSNAPCAILSCVPVCRSRRSSGFFRQQCGHLNGFSLEPPGYLVTVKLHADAELPARRINWRTTCPEHSHSVVGSPVISSGIFKTTCTTVPIGSDESEAKRIPRSDRFTDSPRRSGAADFQTRIRSAVLIS